MRLILALAATALLSSCRTDEARPEAARPARKDSTGLALPSKPAGIVEVLNGTGRKGAGNLVAERLRREGFDVVKVGNAPEKTFSKTIVAERRDAPQIAAKIASVLGVRATCPYHNEILLVDATVFVGRDIEEILTP